MSRDINARIDNMNRKSIRCTLLAATIALTATPVGADWLQEGKELLKEGTTANAASLSGADIGKGLKEALRVGTQNVVNRLGTKGGFNNDPAVHIGLPKGLKNVKSVLGAVGKGSLMDDLELKMNQAAEAATPQR